MNLPDIELVSAKVHEAWMKSKIANGVQSRKSEKGEELMVPYDYLTEESKKLDRNTVQAVYDAINELEKK
jgi:RyR domain